MIKRMQPERAGLEKFLGPLEVTVMLAVWKGARTIPEIYKQVLRSDNDFAYTTIKTVTQRLALKGVLFREGNRYRPYYTTEEAFIVAALKEVLLAAFEDFPRELDEAIAQYYTSVALGGLK